MSTKWIKKSSFVKKKNKKEHYENMTIMGDSTSTSDQSANSIDVSGNYVKLQKKIGNSWQIFKALTTGVIDTIVSPFFEIDKGIDNAVTYTLNNITSNNKNSVSNKRDRKFNNVFSNDWLSWRSNDKKPFESFTEGLSSDTAKSIDEYLKIYGVTINNIYNNHQWLEENDLSYNFAEYYCQRLTNFKNTDSSYNTQDLLTLNNQIDSDLYETDNDGNPKLLNDLKNIEFTCFQNPNIDTSGNGVANAYTKTKDNKKPNLNKKPNPNKKVPAKLPTPDPLIMKDSILVKQFIYQILLLPIYFYISYNFYYVMYFRNDNVFGKENVEGNVEENIFKRLGCTENKFPDWNDFFDQDNAFTNFATELLFKPAGLITVFMNCFKNDSSIFAFNKIAPYITFMITFLIISSLLNSYSTQIWSILNQLYNYKIDSGLYSYCSIIIWLCFVISFFKSLIRTATDFAAKSVVVPPTYVSIILTIFVFIVYWILKGILTAYIIPFSAVIFIVYVFYLMFFPVTTPIINNINQFINSKLFEKEKINVDLYEETDEDMNNSNSYKTFKKFGSLLNKIIDYVREPSKYIFYFFFELILWFLYGAFNDKIYASLESEKTPAIKTIFIIITLIFRILLAVWTGMKWLNLSEYFKEQELKPTIEDPEPGCEKENFKEKKPIFQSLGKEIYRVLGINKEIEKNKKNVMKAFGKSFGSIFEGGNSEIKNIIGENIDVGDFLKKTGIDTSAIDPSVFDPSKFKNILNNVDLKDPAKFLDNIKENIPSDLKDVFDKNIDSGEISDLASKIQKQDFFKNLKNITETGDLTNIDNFKMAKNIENYKSLLPQTAFPKYALTALKNLQNN